MKQKDINSINSIEFSAPDAIERAESCVVRIVDGARGSDNGYANFLTRVTFVDGRVMRLLFLESYGDDMHRAVRLRIFGQEFPVECCIDIDSKVFYWGFKPVTYSLTLHKIGVLIKENSTDILMDAPHLAINSKRPYRFEINYLKIESYLAGETGWSDLRKGLMAVVRLGNEGVNGHIRYVAKYED